MRQPVDDLTFLTVAAVLAAVITGISIIVWGAWEKYKGNRQDGDDEGESGWGGNGGWTGKPSGRPPGGGGPGRDMDRQFHAVADAVGKTVKIEEKEREKVLT